MKYIKNLILALALMIVVTNTMATAQTNIERFRNIRVSNDADLNGDLDVDGTANLDVTDIDGAVDMASTLSIDGVATFNSDATVAGVIALDDTDSVLTGAQTITPTYSYLQVSPTALLTLTLSTGGAADGDIVIIHNLVTTNTNIVDTGATAGGGAIDLAQDDVAGFIFGDGVWVELLSPDNS